MEKWVRRIIFCQFSKKKGLNVYPVIEGYVASLKKHNEPIPHAITEELVEVAV